MNREAEPIRREFWLQKYRRGYGFNEDLPIYRVALGNLIDATARETFPVGYPMSLPPQLAHELWSKSGSIGFMDVTNKEVSIPKEDAIPQSSPVYEDIYDPHNCERRRALVIQKIGIELEYQERGYARLLVQRAADLARGWGIDTIVFEQIQNKKVRRWVTRLGGTLYRIDSEGYLMGVIRMTTQRG